jgi:HD-GYP domain-containing protein (c-di-GMP phosphodiesterase class II)
LHQCRADNLSHWNGVSHAELVADNHINMADCWINLGWQGGVETRSECAATARKYLDQVIVAPRNELEHFMLGLNRIETLLLEGRMREARESLLELTFTQRVASLKIASAHPLLYCLQARLALLEEDVDEMIRHLSRALAESSIFPHAFQEYQIVTIALRLLEATMVSRKTIAPLFQAMVTMLEAKDLYTGHGHSEVIATTTIELWRAWQGDFHFQDMQDELYWAAYLHDIGKLKLPRSLLSKTGPLAPREYEILKRHAALSNEVLIPFGVPRIGEWAGEHHQDACGRGYPGTQPASAMGMCIALSEIMEAAGSSGRIFRTSKPPGLVLKELEALGPDRYPEDLLAASRQVWSVLS